MTNRVTAAVAAGVLAIGLLTGAAGAVLIGSATSPSNGDYVNRMSQMHDYMNDVFGTQPGQGMMGSQPGQGMMSSGSVHMPFRALDHAGGQP